MSSRKTSPSRLVAMQAPSPADPGLNRRSFGFCDSFPSLISQHPYYSFLSQLVSSSEKLFQFYKPGLPSSSFHEALERKKDESPFSLLLFQVGGSSAQFLTFSIHCTVPSLAPAVSLMLSLSSPRGLFIFILYKQSLRLGLLVRIPQPSSLRSKGGIQQVNEKFSLCPLRIEEGII